MDLNSFRSNVESGSEDARFTAWLNLYSSQEQQAKDEISDIINGSNAVLKIMFAKFLASIHEERSCEFLCTFMQDQNPVVVQAALQSFDKNREEQKHKPLIKLIHSPNKTVQLFAIDRLSTAGTEEIVDPLIQMLPTAPTELVQAILTGLRFLADKRVVKPIKSYIYHAHQEIRFKALLVFSALYENGMVSIQKYLIKALGDNDPQIRQAAIWSLKKIYQRKHLKIFLHHSKNDPSSLVRQESLIALAKFPKPKVIDHILQILVTDKDRMVLLKAEATLLSMPTFQLVRGLKRDLNSDNRYIREKVLLFLAEFQRGSKTYYQYITKSLKRVAPDNHMEKIPLIESLGILQNRSAVEVLESFLHDHPLVSYTAMNALLKIWGGDPNFPLLKYLNIDGLSFLNIQMTLKHFTRICHRDMFTDSLLDKLISLLSHQNLNIRYLTAQTLIESHSDKIHEPFFQMVLQEEDPTAKRLLRENILKAFNRDPQIFINLMAKHKSHEDAVGYLFLMLREITWTANQWVEVVIELVEEPHEFLKGAHQNDLIELCIFLLFKKQFELKQLLKGIEHSKHHQLFLQKLSDKLSRQSKMRFEIPKHYIQKNFHPQNKDMSHSLISLIKLSSNADLSTFLVSVLCNNSYKEFHDQASEVLHKIVRSA